MADKLGTYSVKTLGEFSKEIGLPQADWQKLLPQFTVGENVKEQDTPDSNGREYTRYKNPFMSVDESGQAKTDESVYNPQAQGNEGYWRTGQMWSALKDPQSIAIDDSKGIYVLPKDALAKPGGYSYSDLLYIPKNISQFIDPKTGTIDKGKYESFLSQNEGKLFDTPYLEWKDHLLREAGFDLPENKAGSGWGNFAHGWDVSPQAAKIIASVVAAIGGGLAGGAALGGVGVGAAAGTSTGLSAGGAALGSGIIGATTGGTSVGGNDPWAIFRGAAIGGASGALGGYVGAGGLENLSGAVGGALTAAGVPAETALTAGNVITATGLGAARGAVTGDPETGAISGLIGSATPVLTGVGTEQISSATGLPVAASGALSSAAVDAATQAVMNQGEINPLGVGLAAGQGLISSAMNSRNQTEPAKTEEPTLNLGTARDFNVSAALPYVTTGAAAPLMQNAQQPQIQPETTTQTPSGMISVGATNKIAPRIVRASENDPLYFNWNNRTIGRRV